MNKLREVRWAGHVGEEGCTYVIGGKARRKKRPLGRPSCRWVDNIKIDLGEIECGGMDWTGLAQDRDKWRALVNVVMSLRVPRNAGKLSSGFTTGGLLSSAQLHRVSQL
jgi:hypothetical protein